MSDDIAIKVHAVSKNFVLPHERNNTVKSAFVSVARAKHNKGKEVQHALKDINIEIKKGEFFGIVGRNGSGKSTLLKLLAGIYQPTSGSIQVHGRLVPFIELGVGFNPELTGRENVYLNGAMLGFSRKEIEAMYDDIVSFAELERFMDQRLKNYSSGMQVRLAFSMATRAEADILLVDEVLAVGDADFQRKCFQYFRSLKKDKKTVVFVSHDMEAVREYCDNCALIDDSKLIFQGSPDVAAEKYTQLFNASFDSDQQESNNTRWGDGAAQFNKLTLDLNEKEFSIATSVQFNEDMIDPILGFLVKNASGGTVCGTNSKIIGLKVGAVSAGTTLAINWTVPNIFSDDNYTVEVAVTHSDNVTQADWWHDAANFSVRKQRSTSHIISPDIEMSIN